MAALQKPFLIFFSLIYFQLCHAQKDKSYFKADSIASLYKNESLANLPLLTHKLTKDLNSETSKFRAIYSWISNNISFDNKLYEQNKRKTKKYGFNSKDLLEWNKNIKSRYLKNLRDKKTTVCNGYAYLLKKMCDLANIESEIIIGYGRNTEANVQGKPWVNHSWNSVKLNNQWYLCDATWSSGYIELNNKGVNFIHEYIDGYFLASPSLFSYNHFPKNTEWLLKTELNNLDDFMTQVLIYKHAFQYNVKPISHTQLNITTNRNEPIDFIFEFEKKDIEKIQVKLYSNKITDYTNSTFTNLGNNQVTVSITPKIKGTYEAHFFIEDKIIFTYTLKVQKK